MVDFTIGAPLTRERASSVMALAAAGTDDPTEVVAYLEHVIEAHPEGHIDFEVFVGHLPALSEPLRSWLTWRLSAFSHLLGQLVKGAAEERFPSGPVSYRLSELARSKAAADRQRFAEHADELINRGDLPLLDALLELDTDRSKKVRRHAYDALRRCSPEMLAHRWSRVSSHAEEAASAKDLSTKRAARALLRALPNEAPTPADLREAPAVDPDTFTTKLIDATASAQAPSVPRDVPPAVRGQTDDDPRSSASIDALAERAAASLSAGETLLAAAGRDDGARAAQKLSALIHAGAPIAERRGALLSWAVNVLARREVPVGPRWDLIQASACNVLRALVLCPGAGQTGPEARAWVRSASIAHLAHWLDHDATPGLPIDSALPCIFTALQELGPLDTDVTESLLAIVLDHRDALGPRFSRGCPLAARGNSFATMLRASKRDDIPDATLEAELQQWADEGARRQAALLPLVPALIAWPEAPALRWLTIASSSDVNCYAHAVREALAAAKRGGPAIPPAALLPLADMWVDKPAAVRIGVVDPLRRMAQAGVPGAEARLRALTTGRSKKVKDKASAALQALGA